MAADLELLPGRRGVPTLVTIRSTRLADLEDELAALHAEATALVSACLPLAHRLFFAAQVVGPEMSQTALQLIAHLERHGRRQDPERAA